MSERPTFAYLSLGAGVQSSALFVLACQGKLDPKPSVAIFADTGDEPQWVYGYLAVLEAFGERHGIPVVRCSRGVLSEWMTSRQRAGKRFVSVPLYTANPDGREGMLRRQCTREFKLYPIHAKVRELMGYTKGQRVKHKVTAYLGISIDEATRMKPSRERWIENRHPLVDMGLTRRACERIIAEAGLPTPRKSSCVYCPYHSDGFWKDLKANYPAEFAKAVAFDEAIRDMTMAGQRNPGYVHRSCKPLAEVDFDPQRDQYDAFENECEGMCGV